MDLLTRCYSNVSNIIECVIRINKSSLINDVLIGQLTEFIRWKTSHLHLLDKFSREK